MTIQPTCGQESNGFYSEQSDYSLILLFLWYTGMSNTQQFTQEIKAEAQRLGFFACGVAKARRVDADEERRLRRWLESGMNADMDYMHNYLDKRLDPRLLMPGLQTILSLVMNYAPARTLPEGEPQIAAYALGQDYHDVMKNRLHLLAAFIEQQLKAGNAIPANQPLNYRAFVDSAPVLERYWAVQAGLGWIGRNHQLIIPRAGSMFFIGELFLDFELQYDAPMSGRCGNCSLCITHCSTHALSADRNFDARRCLSYQTIENRGQLSDEARHGMGEYIYGCDRCQTVCPWNRFAQPNHTEEFQPKPELLGMTRKKWEQLTVEDYRRLFKGSAVKRAKYDGLTRNIKAYAEESAAEENKNHADEP